MSIAEIWNKLKPCERCKDKERVWIGNRNGKWYVRCGKCGLHTFEDTIKIVIYDWNS